MCKCYGKSCKDFVLTMLTILPYLAYNNLTMQGNGNGAVKPDQEEGQHRICSSRSNGWQSTNQCNSGWSL